MLVIDTFVDWLYSTEKPDYGWFECKTTQTLMLPYDQKNGCWVLSSLGIQTTIQYEAIRFYDKIVNLSAVSKIVKC